MTYRILSVAALAAAVCFASPALACKGTNVLLEDTFEDDSTLGTDVSEFGAIADGTFKLTAKKGYFYHLFYRQDTYDKADICLTVALLNGVEAGAGLLFNAAGGDDFYYFWVNPGGVAGIQRLQNKKWTKPVPSRKVQTDAKKPVTLRLTLEGDHATAYVNDQKLANFKVKPAEGGGLIGIGANAGDNDVTWGFSKLKVTDLP